MHVQYMTLGVMVCQTRMVLPVDFIILLGVMIGQDNDNINCLLNDYPKDMYTVELDSLRTHDLMLKCMVLV